MAIGKVSRALFVLAALAVLTLLFQCNNNDKNIRGVWKLQTMEVNGTIINGESLGTWFWEFNDEGGYLTMIAGEKEKGHYSVSNSRLKMKSVTHEERPGVEYTIEKLDTTELNVAGIGNNKVKLHFIKAAKEDTEEND